MIIHISFRVYSSFRDAFFAGLLHFGTKMKVLIVFTVAISVCLAQRRPSQSSQYQDSQPAETAAQDYQAPEQQYQAGDARSRTRELTTPIPIIRYDKEQGNDGSYKAAWETGNNILAQEEGFLKELGPDPNEEGGILAAQVQQGSYSYTAPDGQIISVNYIADEKGFHPSGDHLPTPPPVSPEVQKGLDLIYAGIRAQQLYKNGELPNKPRVNIYRGKTKASGINAANLIDFKIGLIKGQLSAKSPETQLALQSILQNSSPEKSDVINSNEFKQNTIRTTVKNTKNKENNGPDVVLINYNGKQKALFESSTERKSIPSLSIVREDLDNINTGLRNSNNTRVRTDESAKRETIKRQPQIYFHSTYNTVNTNRNENDVNEQKITKQQDIEDANNRFSQEGLDQLTNDNTTNAPSLNGAPQKDKHEISGFNANSLSSTTSTTSFQNTRVNHENSHTLFSPISPTPISQSQLNKNAVIKDDKIYFKSQANTPNTRLLSDHGGKVLDNSKHVSAQFRDQNIQNKFDTETSNANINAPNTNLQDSFNSNQRIHNQFKSQITNHNNDRTFNPLHDSLKTANINQAVPTRRNSFSSKSTGTSEAKNSNLLFSTQTVFHPPPFNQDQIAETSINSNAQTNNTSSVPNFLISLTPPSQENSSINRNNLPASNINKEAPKVLNVKNNASPVPDFLLTLIPPTKQNVPISNTHQIGQLKANKNDFLSSLKTSTQHNIATSITNQNDELKANENDYLSSLKPAAKQNSQNNNAINQSVKLNDNTQDLPKLLNINLEDMINAQNKLCSFIESITNDNYTKCSSIVGGVEEFCKNSKRSSSAVLNILKNRFN